jgi:hypothetical protein
MTIRAALATATLGLITTLGACQKKEETPPPAPAAPAPTTAAPAAPAAPAAQPAAAGTGTVKGLVKLSGTPPEMKQLRRDTDPYCARQQMKDEEVMVGPGGGLKNVLLRVKGISGNYEPPMTNANLDQSECMYRPRVQAIMAGQSLLIRNGDQTLHNVHAYKGASTQFNQAEVPGLPPIAKKFNNAGDIIKFKCDVHPWMTGYVAISNNPFFAVTGDDGTFQIPKVPAGKYTLEAWHERYGTKTADLVVEADKPAEVKLEFEAK